MHSRKAEIEMLSMILIELFMRVIIKREKSDKLKKTDTFCIPMKFQIIYKKKIMLLLFHVKNIFFCIEQHFFYSDIFLFMTFDTSRTCSLKNIYSIKDIL